MVNILIPAMGGADTYFKDYYFPKLMLEVGGETILEKVITHFESVRNKKFIFVFDESDCVKFHIDDSAYVTTNYQCSIIALKNATRGPLCTCLMAIDEINNHEPLIIANSDQIIDEHYETIMDYFNMNHFEAGVVTFPSIHPRWDYVRLEGDEVIEVCRKKPISKNAIAGVFYFSHGSDFIQAGKSAILKTCFSKDSFSISSALNEMILMNKRVGHYEIGKEQFHSFYSPEKIREYNK